jgi:hypothetical protein
MSCGRREQGRELEKEQERREFGLEVPAPRARRSAKRVEPRRPRWGELKQEQEQQEEKGEEVVGLGGR